MAKQLERDAPAAPALYDSDFYSWCLDQARLVRERRFAELDIDNVVEELESLGKEQAHALRSSYRVLLMHLLKWRYQPERRSGSWAGTIVRERANAADRLKESPGLKPRQSGLVREAYRVARREAAAETSLPLATFPETCPFHIDQALDDDFWPEAAG
jgi:hypothetical protein